MESDILLSNSKKHTELRSRLEKELAALTLQLATMDESSKE